MSHCLAIVTGSFIYTCNQCLSPLSISVRVPVVFTIQLNRIKLTSYPYCFSETLFHFWCFDYFVLFHLGGGGTCVSCTQCYLCLSVVHSWFTPPPPLFLIGLLWRVFTTCRLSFSKRRASHCVWSWTGYTVK